MITAKQAASQALVTIEPQVSIEEAASIMAQFNVGMLPVVAGSQAVGVVTDRDIAVRGMALENPNLPVTRIMSRHPVAVDESDRLESVAEVMKAHRVRPVLVNRSDGTLLGVVSLDDLSSNLLGDSVAGRVLQSLTLSRGAKNAHRRGFLRLWQGRS